eukprot:TRINITY_DN4922_c0_g3_i1.p1 TRINITY_DN4922_c0_g3~~TRINITY_DN4922_c0_g3_i1.p1  ORF type:complete len:118 (+),score=1.66 TRINITY_DN4922_c0_g3_i1:143-496(+)
MSAVVSSLGNGELLQLMLREHSSDLARLQRELNASTVSQGVLARELEELRRSFAFNQTMNRAREQLLAAECRLHQELQFIKAQHSQCEQVIAATRSECQSLKVCTPQILLSRNALRN